MAAIRTACLWTPAPDSGGAGKRIAASLLTTGERPAFAVTAGGETISLVNNSSLNRWIATGITGRHNLLVSPDGITIDGKKIPYDHPNAVQDLERILNGTLERTSDTGSKAPATPSAPTPSSTKARAAEPADGSNRVRVTRDGFEFHIVYRTKFGQVKDERLEAALESLQKMGRFKPHVGIQKTGIRLAVTTWDGDKFLSQPGIANLERATPEELENLLNTNIEGAPETSTAATSRTGGEPANPVVAIGFAKKPKETRFSVVFHKRDGSKEDGPLLIRPNLDKLRNSGLFQPGVSISMTALNDAVIIERICPEDGQEKKRSESLPLKTTEDAEKLGVALTACLRPPPTAGAVVAEEPSVAQSPAEATAPVAASPSPEATQAPPPDTEPSPPASVQSEPVVAEFAPAGEGKPKPPAAAETVSAAKAGGPAGKGDAKPAVESYTVAWLAEILVAVESMPPEDLHRAVFDAVQQHFSLSLAANDLGYPAIQIPASGGDSGEKGLRLVRLNRYLVLEEEEGYVRFGAETRVFLSRLDDYLEFARAALRGAGIQKETGRLVFVVTDEFLAFLKTAAAREYRNQFGKRFLPASHLTSDFEPIWPRSREEELFHRLAETAAKYGLPVTADSVVLDPAAECFLGFKRLPGHGLEFRHGENFVRFLPEQSEVKIDQFDYRFPRRARVLGWALDGSEKLCAIYEASSGFAPPRQSKLVRFLTAEEIEAERSSLNFLALLEASR